MPQLHQTGEEYMQKESFGGGTGVSSVEVGLFNNSVDSLGDGATLADVTTEPSGSNYSRQSATIDSDFTLQLSGGDWESVIDDQTFDTSDSGDDVDSYFVIANFTSDEEGAGDHLLYSGELDQLYDLSHVDTFTLTEARLSLD